jgi:putative cardiolipin synthase
MTSAKPPRTLFLRVALLTLIGAFVSGCATLRTDMPKPASTSPPPVADTPSTRYVQSETSAHGNDSGFRPLTSNTNALMSRVVLIDHAEHTLDLQYYIFDNDATGRLIAQRVLAAADRGVRVRILLDDLDIEGHQHDSLLDALDAHPNIEIRLFNPFKFRNRSVFSKAGQFIFDGKRLNRRMHNKSFIVDGMQAVIGGRNIGDAYFDAGDQVHFSDIDVLVIGPVVPKISAMFDTYWNAESAYPVTAYTSVAATPENLAKLRVALAKDARAFAESDYAQALSDALPNGPSADRKGRWFWGPATLIADDPRKVEPDHDGRTRLIAPELREMLDGSTREALLISPYFIPGDNGVRYLDALVQRGVTVKVLTNALAATDEPEVHAGYSHYRVPLLEGGVDLFELKPIPGKPSKRSHGTSSGESLHAKSMIVDRRRVFVGSMNLDPRSRKLNTEMGVIVDCPGLAEALQKYFDAATAPENAYHLVLMRPEGKPNAKPDLRWVSVEQGKPTTYEHDPETSRWTRMRVGLMRVLPIEDQL